MGKKKKCVIIGASDVYDSNEIILHANTADYVICADGGLSTAIACNIRVDIVVGDFDSFDYTNIPSELEVLRLPHRKDDTDMMISVKKALSLGDVSEIIIFGATGGRIDHTYGNLCVLKYLLERKITAKIKSDTQEIFLLQANDEFRFYNKIGITVSVFPFACDRCIVSYNGFDYGGESCILSIDNPTGISNVIMCNESTLHINSGYALIICTVS